MRLCVVPRMLANVGQSASAVMHCGINRRHACEGSVRVYSSTPSAVSPSGASPPATCQRPSPLVRRQRQPLCSNPLPPRTGFGRWWLRIEQCVPAVGGHVSRSHDGGYDVPTTVPHWRGRCCPGSNGRTGWSTRCRRCCSRHNHSTTHTSTATGTKQRQAWQGAKAIRQDSAIDTTPLLSERRQGTGGHI